MIIFAKICKSKYYKDFILLFVHPAFFWYCNPKKKCLEQGNKKRRETCALCPQI